MPATGAGLDCPKWRHGFLDAARLRCAKPLARARGLSAVHVHHGLHPDADVWADQAQRRRSRLGVPCRSTVCKSIRADRVWRPRPGKRVMRSLQVLSADAVLLLAHHREIRLKPCCCACCAAPPSMAWGPCVRCGPAVMAGWRDRG